MWFFSPRLTPEHSVLVRKVRFSSRPATSEKKGFIQERSLSQLYIQKMEGGNTAEGNTAEGNTAKGNTAEGNTAKGYTAEGIKTQIIF